MLRALFLTGLSALLFSGCDNPRAGTPAPDTHRPAPVAELKDFPKDLQLRAQLATVRITNLEKGTTGSGVFVGRDSKGVCRFLTAAHVVKTGDLFKLTICSPDPLVPDKVYQEKMTVEYSQVDDLALIELKTDVEMPADEMPAPLPLCPAKAVPTAKNFAALTVGYGDGGPPSCEAVIVAGRKRPILPGEIRERDMWEVTPATEEGRSGGPLLDAKGRLLGIASGVGDGKGYYVYTSTVRVFVETHVPKEK